MTVGLAVSSSCPILTSKVEFLSSFQDVVFGHSTARPPNNVTKTARLTILQPSKHEPMNGLDSSNAKVLRLYLPALPFMCIQASAEQS